MLNRRLIRIKAFKELFAFEFSGGTSPQAAVSNLMKDCDKTRELYCFLLNITGSLVKVARERIDAGMRKFHPSEEEANPNLKFVNNRFAALVCDDPKFGSFCQKKGLVWAEYDVFVKKTFASIQSSDYYKQYMTSGEDSFEEDCSVFQHIFEAEFEDNQQLYAILEDMYVSWGDEVAFVLNVIIRNIDLVKRTSRLPQVEPFQNEEDRDFARRLLEESIIGFEGYRNLVFENVINYESDRLVSTDIILIVMGLAEAMTFPSIPVKVTINEYVEISKYYSTPNSRVFVNGMLDKIIQQKVSEGEIIKTGRGLDEGRKEA